MAKKKTDIPTDKEKWLSEARQSDVHKSIHSMRDLASASKMDKKQFLALRTCWVQYDRSDFNAQYWGITRVDEAEKRLGKMPSWICYLDKIKVNESNPIPVIPESVGSFSNVSYYQQMVQQTGGTEQGEPRAGPAMKTRSTTDVETTAETGIQPVTPISMNINQMFANIGLGSGSDKQSSVEESPSSPLFDEKLDQQMYPKADDEQIVNSCLIIFFNTLALHSPA